jgi:hypothetical protein
VSSGECNHSAELFAMSKMLVPGEIGMPYFSKVILFHVHGQWRDQASGGGEWCYLCSILNGAAVRGAALASHPLVIAAS